MAYQGHNQQLYPKQRHQSMVPSPHSQTNEYQRGTQAGSYNNYSRSTGNYQPSRQSANNGGFLNSGTVNINLHPRK